MASVTVGSTYKTYKNYFGENYEEEPRRESLTPVESPSSSPPLISKGKTNNTSKTKKAKNKTGQSIRKKPTVTNHTKNDKKKPVNSKQKVGQKNFSTEEEIEERRTPSPRVITVKAAGEEKETRKTGKGKTKVKNVKDSKNKDSSKADNEEEQNSSKHSNISPMIPVVALVNSSTQTSTTSPRTVPGQLNVGNKGNHKTTQTEAVKKYFQCTQTDQAILEKTTKGEKTATQTPPKSTSSTPSSNNSKSTVKSCKSVSTDTSDLPSSNEQNITSKVIRVENTKKKESRWKKIIGANELAIVPPTPEGPRFSQDGSQLTYTHPGVQAEFIQKIHAFQTQGFMCDVIMRVEGIDFKAHKIVLAASSPYFADLFRNVNIVRMDRLILQGLKAQSVAAMLGYFYLAKLIIDVEDVEDLLDSAYYFKTMEVVKLCTDYLELQLSLHNAFHFYHIALKHDIQNLRLKSFRYICWNFKSIIRGEEFLQIEGEILIQVVASKQVKVRAEEEVYEGVWNWYAYNKEDRGFYIPKLILYLHFELMELEFLEEVVKKQMYLESELCRKKVDDAKRVIKNGIDTDERRLDRHRQASDNVYIFTTNKTTCQLLSLLDAKLADCPELNMPVPMIDTDYHVTVKASKLLFTLSRSKVTMFNPSNLNWEYFSPGVPIHEAGICATKTSIFVVGGKADGKQLYELSLGTKQWTKLPDMVHDRRFPSVSTMGNTKPRVFAAGGFSPSKSCVLDNMEYYVSSDKAWKNIKLSMSVPRMKASMLVNGDKVYIAGGRSEEQSHSTMDVYDRMSQKWSKIDNLSGTKEISTLVLFEGKIYCVGGDETTHIDVLVQGSDDKRGKWEEVGNLKKLLRDFQCIAYTPM